MTSFKYVKQILGLAALVALGCIFVFLRMPSNTPFWREFENFGHAPLFGCVSLAILYLIRSLAGRWIRHPIVLYLMAFIVATGLGGMSELWQHFNGRDADVADLVNDIIGSISFLVFWWTLDRAAAADLALNRTRVWSVRVLAVLLLIVPAAPVLGWAAVVLHRNSILPRLGAFDSPLERKLFETRDARLDIVTPPKAWSPTPEGKVGRVTFYPSTYPSLLFTYVYPRWDGYRSLALDVFSDEDSTVDMAFRIYDAGSTGCYPDRYNNIFKITPGLNQIDLPLDTIKLTTSGREMNLGHTAGIIVFLIEPKDTISLYFDDFRLE